MAGWRRPLRIALLVLGVLSALLLLAFMFREPLTRALLFYPERGQSRRPDALGLPYEELWLRAEDGVRTQAWWIPGEAGGPVVVFFHGNAGTIADRLESARALHQLGVSLLLAEYRGYGDSEGRPSERGLYADARAAVDEARRRAGERRLILFGRSLGGAVAVHAATEREVDALVLEATFTSLPAMARQVVKVPGAGLLAGYDFDSLAKIRDLDIPVLIFHGRADELVPFAMGERLAAANPRASLHPVPGGGHNDTWLVGGEDYWSAWRRFLNRLE